MSNAKRSSLFLVNRKEEVNGILALYTCRLLLGNEILGCEKKDRSCESGVRERSIVICGMQRSSPVEWLSVDGRHERGNTREDAHSVEEFCQISYSTTILHHPSSPSTDSSISLVPSTRLACVTSVLALEMCRSAESECSVRFTRFPLYLATSPAAR